MHIFDLRPFATFAVTLRALLADPSFRAAFALLSAIVLVGTIFYAVVEGWSLLDSLYFSVITASTVGFGDFAPTTAPGRAFTIVYVLISVGLLVFILSRIAAGMVERKVAHDAAKKRQRRRSRRRGSTTGPDDTGDPAPRLD